MELKRIKFLGLVLGLSAFTALAFAEQVVSDPAPQKIDLSAAVPVSTTSGGQYIRYSETAKVGKLQTAIAHFVRDRDGASVDLIAVIHIADQSYYDDLDNRMIAYDGVLYEMVGGPYNSEVEEAVPEEGSPLEVLKMIHGMIQNLLKLEYQKDGIDYLRGNFIHADVDWKQFQALSEQRNQTLATWFQRAMNLANSENLPGLPNDEKESQAMLASLLGAVLKGDSATLKRTLAPILSESESLIARLEGEDGTILVTERNKVAFEAMHEQLRFGKRRLAVLYGAGHMPDFEKRLSTLGFHKVSSEWVTAWHIKDDPSVTKMNILGDLFKDDRVGALLNTAMKLIEQTGATSAKKAE